MLIQELKSIITNKQYDGRFFIFVYKDSKFIAHQYIEKLITDFNFDINYKTEIDSTIITGSSIFGDLSEGVLRVFDVDTFDYNDFNLSSEKNLIIVCKKVSSQVLNMYSQFIVDIPKIESWQIKDFVYSVGEGLQESDLDSLIDLCNNDIYRLSMELDKLTIFPDSIRRDLLKQFMVDGVFNDLSDSTIFDFCSAILKKDTKKLAYIYSQLESMDVSPVGFVQILYQNIKDIIKIQLGVKPTPESTNIQRNRFFAIKYNNLNIFSGKQLISMFKILTDVDKKIKLGQLDVNDVIDYLIVSIFSC